MLQRVATSSARHPRRTLLVWLLAVIASIAAVPVLFSSLTSDMGSGAPTESQRANEVRHELKRRLPAAARATDGDTVIGAVDGVDLDVPATRRALGAAVTRIAGLAGVAHVADPASDPGLLARDHRAAAVVVTLDDGVDPHDVDDEVHAALAATGASKVLVSYDGLVDDEIQAQAEQDLQRGETIAVPLALAVLVLVFGGLLAGLLPVVLALASVVGAFAVLTMVSFTGDVAVYAINVVTMLGLAVGIDYGLIVVSRFREERGHGHSVDDALARTIATSIRTIGFSGLTVAVALAGLLVFDSAGLRSLAAGGIGVVLMAVLAGTTLLPALLVLFGHRIRPAVPRRSVGPFWRLAGVVRRHALPIVLVVGAALVVAALPFLHARFENPDARSLPSSSTARQVAELRERFPIGAADPIAVVAMTTPGDAALDTFVRRVEAIPGVAAADVDTTLAPAGGVVVDVTPTGTTQGPAAQSLVGRLRRLDAPFRTYVGGDAAELVDLKHHVADRLPLALGIVAAATLVLLFLMTGSVVVALKAIVMNVLSLGATFGVLVWIFQDGHLAGLLGIDPVGALDVTIPLIVFLFAFGLSMDYEVFLLARIEEEWRATGDNDLAVAVGLDRTGRIITSAAVLVVIVFAGFAAGDLVLIEQLGVGLAVAVVVDATIVRTLLVPAVMSLMGKANWWSPPMLRRIHARFGLREHDGVAPAAPAAVTDTVREQESVVPSR